MEILDHYLDTSTEDNEEIYWSDNSPVFFDGGNILKLAGTKVKDHWEIAFDRTKPKVITSPAGYFTGAAGMVVALLQIYCLEKNKNRIVGLIDDPYYK